MVVSLLLLFLACFVVISLIQEFRHDKTMSWIGREYNTILLCNFCSWPWLSTWVQLKQVSLSLRLHLWLQDSISHISESSFQELPGVHCYGCLSDLSTSEKEDQEPGVVLQCSDCKHLFCFNCDVYVHESLHNCPGCEASTGRHHDVDHDDMMLPDWGRNMENDILCYKTLQYAFCPWLWRSKPQA